MQNTVTLLFLCLTTLSCTVSKNNEHQLSEIKRLQGTIDSLSNELAQEKTNSGNEIATFLTFQDGNAEKAMNFYVDLFDNSEVVNVQHWGEGAPGEKGKVMHATFSLRGNLFMCSDSPPIHEWDFSPSVSNYMECKNERELQRLFSKLSENGTVTMPLNNYGFSQQFGWVIDQFGISWQLNLK